MIDWPVVYGGFGLGLTILVQVMAWNSHARKQGALEARVDMKLDQQARDSAELKGAMGTLTSSVNSLTTVVAVQGSEIKDLGRRMETVEGK